MEQVKGSRLTKNVGLAMGKPDYGNWVSRRLIYVFGTLGLIFIVASLLAILVGQDLLALPFIVLTALSLVIAVYFTYARYLFSPQGKNVQDQVWNLVMNHLDWSGDGRVLDIGCGNAALTIKVAKKYPNAQIVGVDYWGKNWEYGKRTCEKNAAIEGVSDRVSFQQASASKLPFEDGSFDVAVSNLTFHEVRDAKDKREVVREGLRVIKKGGIFVFQDLFLIKQAYGDTDDLVRTIKGWGIEQAEFIKTRDEPFIPRALKLPFMVGTMGIISGKK